MTLELSILAEDKVGISLFWRGRGSYSMGKKRAKCFEPRLVRALKHQHEARQGGQSTEHWAQEIAELQKDPREFMLALKFILDLDRLTEVEKLRQVRDEGIAAALRRTDLTRYEALQLLKVVKEAEAEVEQMALRSLEREQQARFRGC